MADGSRAACEGAPLPLLLCDADIADVGREMESIGLNFSKWCAATASIFGDVTSGLRVEGPSRPASSHHYFSIRRRLC
jgi:hypothetical protein